ncbi:M36 family metallopeptidase [Streptomyces sp. NBC_00846]|uniref:M36 family metallopeptidase n=1 Tax=Streptomyces sp. NBC_00846 TaxID=2975849 RepID=UPI003863AAA8|nr:M36 family metallopeptidase [Streptomyces sp. NBC_00846]
MGGDPEMGVARSGGNNPATRNNANQSTGADGGVALTNMYLWQPQAGAFYGRCADGNFDNSVIGHEYTHAITNRMIGGGTTGLSGAHGGSMGESWSDLVSTERLIETGAVPDGVDPWVVGPYVTDNNERGIRNSWSLARTAPGMDRLRHGAMPHHVKQLHAVARRLLPWGSRPTPGAAASLRRTGEGT